MENLFVSAGDFICKISTRGKLIFAANLKNIIENENAVPHGLAVLEKNSRCFLLVVDFRLACIHRFEIQYRKN
jgi:hypothetical protein